MGLPGGWELILIVLVLVLLFGATKLPQMARSLGQSARVFKAEARGMKADEEAAKKAEEEKPKPELTAGETSAPPVTSPSPADEKQRNDSKN